MRSHNRIGRRSPSALYIESWKEQKSKSHQILNFRAKIKFFPFLQKKVERFHFEFSCQKFKFFPFSKKVARSQFEFSRQNSNFPIYLKKKCSKILILNFCAKIRKLENFLCRLSKDFLIDSSRPEFKSKWKNRMEMNLYISTIVQGKW